jgi:hypothetical protein
MIRKAISIVTMLVAAVLLFGQQTMKADTLYATALTGHNGKYEVYTVGAASGNAAGASGWIYLGMADGSWLDGNFITLSVSPSGDTSAVMAGYLYDSIPCLSYLTVSHGLVSISIIGYGTNHTYVNSVNGSTYYGGIQTSK